MDSTNKSLDIRVGLVFQVFISICSFLLAIGLYNLFAPGTYSNYYEVQIIILALMPTWYIGLKHYQLGRMHRLRSFSSLLVSYMQAIGIGAGVLLSVVFIFNLTSLPRIVILLFVVLNLVMLTLYQFLYYETMKNYRKQGKKGHAVLLIGGRTTGKIAEYIENQLELGMHIVGICTDSSTVVKKYQDTIPCYPRDHDLTPIMDNNAVDEIIYCATKINRDEVAGLIVHCKEVGVVFRLQSEFLNVKGIDSEMSFIHDIPFLTYRNAPNKSEALFVKSVFDVVASSLIVLALSPVFLVIGALIKLEDGGPVFFKQVRVGKNGRHFKCLKFRSMVTNSERRLQELMDKNEQIGPVFKMTHDARVTRIGRFVRKTSLDELPQFINVIRGEMSIVGPRPPIPDEVMKYQRWQRRRLSMKPGITCIWQVSGRNAIEFDEWMKLDLQYIDSWSLRLDLVLFFRTIRVILFPDGK